MYLILRKRTILEGLDSKMRKDNWKILKKVSSQLDPAITIDVRQQNTYDSLH